MKVLALIFALISSVSVMAGPGENCGSNPSGPEYVIAGTSRSYSTWTTQVQYYGDKVDFWNDENFRTSGTLRFSGLKLKASKRIPFYDRGWGTAYMKAPWSSNLYSCNDIWVQNRPNISKRSFNTSNKTAKIAYSVDTYSKAGRRKAAATVTFRWTSDFYNTSGTISSHSFNANSGTKSITFRVPGIRDVYTIYAQISDGTYTKSVILGEYYNANGSGGGPIN